MSRKELTVQRWAAPILLFVMPSHPLAKTPLPTITLFITHVNHDLSSNLLCSSQDAGWGGGGEAGGGEGELRKRVLELSASWTETSVRNDYVANSKAIPNSVNTNSHATYYALVSGGRGGGPAVAVEKRVQRQSFKRRESIILEMTICYCECVHKLFFPYLSLLPFPFP